MGAGQGKIRRVQARLTRDSSVYDLLPKSARDQWLGLSLESKKIFVFSPIETPKPVAGILRPHQIISLLEKDDGVAIFNRAKDIFLANINNEPFQARRFVNLGSNIPEEQLVVKDLDLRGLDFSGLSLGHVVFRSCDLRDVEMPEVPGSVPAYNAAFEYCLTDDNFWENLNPYENVAGASSVTRTDRNGTQKANLNKITSDFSVAQHKRYGWIPNSMQSLNTLSLDKTTTASRTRPLTIPNGKRY